MGQAELEGRLRGGADADVSGVGGKEGVRRMGIDRRKWEFIKDIVVPVIIGFCSLVVAISANRIAKSSSETARLQALIAKNAEAPTIEVIYLPGGYENDDIIKISILDGKYSNFESETVSFLSIIFVEDNGGGEWVYYRVDLPIDHYLFGRGSQVLYGEIWEWISDSTSKLELLIDSCEEYFNKGDFQQSEAIRWMLSNISVFTCLKCTYLNLLGEEETVYYINQPGSQISRKSGEEWFQKHKDMGDDGFFLYSNSVEQNDVKDVRGLLDAIQASGEQYIEKVDDSIK